MPEMVLIQCREGPVLVEGEVVGPFIVHPTLYVKPDPAQEWTLTHRRTGFAIVVDLPNEAAARALSQRLSDLDWDFETAAAATKALQDECYKRVANFYQALRAQKEA
jgi:hypothetical protein